jgi:arylsulfatase A-like enzyme
MDRRTFIRGATGTTAALGLRHVSLDAEAGARRPPNVLFIMPDEWRGQALACMGNPDVQTPHLDQLASEGILFQQTFANTPVCCPARATILTGTYTSRNGMVANDLRLREHVVTIADAYARAGYHTGFIGKWHLDGGPRVPGFVPPGPRRHGFAYWAANECNHNYFYNWYFRDENAPIVSEKYEPEFWTDLAVEFLHGSKNKPFFLMLAPGAPHDPYLAPEKYMNLYDPERLVLSPNWVAGTPGASRKEIAGYYAAITAVDDQIGRLLGALRELKLDSNTIVLFSSDHGNMLGSQGKILKRKPWEESILVPGIMRYPGVISPGCKTSALFSHVDFAPTLLSLCGLPVPAEMQGADLSRIAAGKSKEGPASVFFQIFGPYKGDGTQRAWRGLRTERFMYARWESGPWLLYDLEQDRDELHNLVDDPAHSSYLGVLDKELMDWMARVGDSWSLDWTAPVEDEERLDRYRAFYTVEDYLSWAKRHPSLTPGVP